MQEGLALVAWVAYVQGEAPGRRDAQGKPGATAEEGPPPGVVVSITVMEEPTTIADGGQATRRSTPVLGDRHTQRTAARDQAVDDKEEVEKVVL